jgi:hypothetical protein
MFESQHAIHSVEGCFGGEFCCTIPEPKMKQTTRNQPNPNQKHQPNGNQNSCDDEICATKEAEGE